MYKEDRILDSWQQNAGNWIATLENEEISSRPLATNRAIVEAVLATKPQRVLDAGCGEGWLTRALAAHNLEVVGVDGVAGLIEYARSQSDNLFYLLSYEELIQGRNVELGLFNTIVFNFALFGKELTVALLKKLRENLQSEGKVVIQTIHPEHDLGRTRSEEGWVQETWEGMKRAYRQPYQWYFRNRREWEELFAAAGYRLTDERSILNPGTGTYLSIIFSLEKQQ